jgi:hypothetical protein
MLNHLGFNFTWGLTLASYQQKWLNPSYNPERIQSAFFENDYFDQYSLDHKTQDALIPFGGVPKTNLFEMKVLVHFKKWQPYYHFRIKSAKKIEKEEWGYFWTLYNVIQFFEDVIKEDEKIKSTQKSYSLEELLSNFPDEIYHDVLVQMFERGLVNSQEDEVKLYTAIDEDENILAEAGLIIEHLKIVFEPCDTQSLIYFENLGYRVESLEELINLEI